MVDRSKSPSAWKTGGKTSEASELPAERIEALLIDRDVDAQRLLKLLADLKNGRAPKKDRDPSTSR